MPVDLCTRAQTHTNDCGADKCGFLFPQKKVKNTQIQFIDRTLLFLFFFNIIRKIPDDNWKSIHSPDCQCLQHLSTIEIIPKFPAKKRNNFSTIQWPQCCTAAQQHSNTSPFFLLSCKHIFIHMKTGIKKMACKSKRKKQIINTEKRICVVNYYA